MARFAVYYVTHHSREWIASISCEETPYSYHDAQIALGAIRALTDWPVASWSDDRKFGRWELRELPGKERTQQ